MLVFLGVAWHEPWRDEADTWVVVRELPLPSFLTYFSYAGHPPLWYALLFPFARAGFPYATLGILHAVIAIGVAYLLLFRSPFPLWLKALIVFSVIMAYQFAVVARGYALMNLILFAIAALFPNRHQKPLLYGGLIGLLFNTEVLAIITGLALTAHFAWETLKDKALPHFKAHLAAILIIGAGGLASLISLLPPPDGNQFVSHMHFYPQAFTEKVEFLTVPWAHLQEQVLGYDDYAQLLNRNVIAFAVPGYLLLLAAAWTIGRSWVLALHASWIAWLCFVYTFKYQGVFYHGEIMLTFIVFAVWLGYYVPGLSARMQRTARRVFNLYLGLILIPSVAACAYQYVSEFKEPYSGSKEMAGFIKTQGLERTPIAYTGCFSLTSITAYLPESDIWMVGEDIHTHYMDWGQKWESCRSMSGGYMLKLIRDDSRYQYVLSEHPFSAHAASPFTLVHNSKGTVWAESFYLYRKTEPAPTPR